MDALENYLSEELIKVKVHRYCRDNLDKLRNDASVETSKAFAKQGCLSHLDNGRLGSLGDLLSSANQVERKHNETCCGTRRGSTKEGAEPASSLAVRHVFWTQVLTHKIFLELDHADLQ